MFILGNQLLQARAIASRGPEDHCKLRFRIGQQTADRQWKERMVVLLNMLVRPAIRKN